MTSGPELARFVNRRLTVAVVTAQVVGASIVFVLLGFVLPLPPPIAVRNDTLLYLDLGAGNVGAADRYEFTVIGDPVNEAARLTELTKQRPGRALASGSAIERAGEDEAAHWTLGEAVALRGRARSTRLAEIVR